MGVLGMGGPDMGGLILYGACNGGPGIVRNVPNPAQLHSTASISVAAASKFILAASQKGELVLQLFPLKNMICTTFVNLYIRK